MAAVVVENKNNRLPLGRDLYYKTKYTNTPSYMCLCRYCVDDSSDIYDDAEFFLPSWALKTYAKCNDRCFPVDASHKGHAPMTLGDIHCWKGNNYGL